MSLPNKTPHPINAPSYPRNLKAEIDNLTHRAYAYWYEDGLGEITTGVVFFLIGLFILILGLANPGTFWWLFSSVAAILAIGLGPWVARPVLKGLKSRLTYPYTGYVAYHTPSKRRRWFSLAVAVLVASALGIVIKQKPEISLVWLPLLEGVAVGGLILFVGFKQRLARYYLLAGLALLLGTVLSLVGVGDLTGVGIFFLAMGTATLVSGSLTRRNFIRRTRVQVEESHAG